MNQSTCHFSCGFLDEHRFSYLLNQLVCSNKMVLAEPVRRCKAIVDSSIVAVDARKTGHGPTHFVTLQARVISMLTIASPRLSIHRRTKNYDEPEIGNRNVVLLSF